MVLRRMFSICELLLRATDDLSKVVFSRPVINLLF